MCIRDSKKMLSPLFARRLSAMNRVTVLRLAILRISLILPREARDFREDKDISISKSMSLFAAVTACSKDSRRLSFR